MELNRLRIFVSVYRNRSFTRASEELGISQPSISENVKNLERELGCLLFERLARRTIPTSEAEAIYPMALHIIEEAERLAEAASLAAGRISGTLVLGASTIPGTYILPQMASDFRKLYPEVSFEVTIGDSREIARSVLNHELVMGFTGAEMETDQLDHLPVVEDELILAAPPSLIKGDTIRAAQLKALPFVIREEGSGTRKIMEQFFERNKIRTNELDIVAVFGSTDSVKQAIKSGLGVSILSRIAVEDELRAGTLREVGINGLELKRSFYLVTHKKRILPAPYRAFYDYVDKL